MGNIKLREAVSVEQTVNVIVKSDLQATQCDVCGKAYEARSKETHWSGNNTCTFKFRNSPVYGVELVQVKYDVCTMTCVSRLLDFSNGIWRNHSNFARVDEFHFRHKRIEDYISSVSVHLDDLNPLTQEQLVASWEARKLVEVGVLKVKAFGA